MGEAGRMLTFTCQARAGNVRKRNYHRRDGRYRSRKEHIHPNGYSKQRCYHRPRPGIRNQNYQGLCPEHKGTRFVLVDCSGFNDTERSDEEILDDIVSWFGRSYQDGKLISAVIYLHKINDTRIQGTTMVHLEILRQLCGENFYPRIILGITFWTSVSEKEGARRKNELLSTQGFFAEMHELGSQTVRIYEDRVKCLSLIEKIAEDQGQAMKVQEELGRGADVRSTSAFRFLVKAENSANLSQRLYMVYLKLLHLSQMTFHALYYLLLQLYASIANRWKLW